MTSPVRLPIRLVNLELITFSIQCSIADHVFFTCILTRRQDSFFIYLMKNIIFLKYMESPLIFILFLKGKTKLEIKL